MKLKNNSNIELHSFAIINVEEIKKQYLSWLNDVEVIELIGGMNMLLPKKESFIEESFERFNQTNCIGFFIYDKETNKYFGTCKLDKISFIDRSVEIGIMIGEKSAQGKGIGKKTYSLLLNYCFEKLGMNRVWGTCFSNNIGSKKLFESMNFKFEGKARQAIYRKGEFLDNLHYSILNTEYKNNNLL